MINVLAAFDTFENIAAIIGVCAVFITMFSIIYSHSTNDKKHLKEGEQPMTQPMCQQVHQGWQQCVVILTEAVKANELRAADALRDLKLDIKTQNSLVIGSIQCLEKKMMEARK
jgi:hypothetical protein